MDKVVINVGYQHYIMPTKDALELARILNNAEHYATKGYGDDKSYFIWSSGKPVINGFEFITDDIYRMAKLAGQPTKE